MKILRIAPLVSLMLILLVGCSNTANYKSIPDSEYVQITNSQFDRFVVSKKGVLASYKKIMFLPLSLESLDVAKTQNSAIDRSWVLDEKDKQFYKGLFQDSIEKVFTASAKSGFSLVDKPGKSTLHANVRLKTLNPQVANMGDSGGGSSLDQTKGSFGDVTVQIVLKDSQTGEFVGIIEDGRALSISTSVAQKVNRANYKYAWIRTFTHWAENLKRESTY